MEEAVSERHKTFAAAHRSDDDRQVYISASRHALFIIVSAKAEALQATCLSFSNLNLSQNLFISFFILSLALLPHIHPLLTSPTIPVSGSRLRSSPATLPSFLSR